MAKFQVWEDNGVRYLRWNGYDFSIENNNLVITEEGEDNDVTVAQIKMDFLKSLAKLSLEDFLVLQEVLKKHLL